MHHSKRPKQGAFCFTAKIVHGVKILFHPCFLPQAYFDAEYFGLQQINGIFVLK
jgi:hypothetical protein